MKSEIPNPPFTLDDSSREVIDSLISHQKELSIGNDEFAKKYLSYSGTVWSRVVSGEYFGMVADPDKIITTLRGDLRGIESSRILESRYGGMEFIKHNDAALVIDSIRQCKSKPLSNPDRLIFYLAPTGGGKSSLCGKLRLDGARIVEARESWLRSYFCAIRDIARACSINPDNYFSADGLEEELIRRLNSRRQVLVIDEGEFFCARTLNLVKLLLNKTTAVIVICAIPQAFDKWATRNWHEALQLRRRTHALVRMTPCDDKTAKLFLRGIDVDESGLKAAAAYARDFGAFDTLSQIRAELAGEDKVGRLEVVKAGNRIRLCQGLSPLLEDK